MNRMRALLPLLVALPLAAQSPHQQLAAKF